MKTNHDEALKLAGNLKGTEGALLTLLMKMDQGKEFQELGYTGIFSYCLNYLKLSESQSQYFSSVARKSKEVPELKKAIDNGTLTLSKARRIVKVITPETQATWIERASTLPQPELDRQVAAVNPSAVKERVKPVSDCRSEVRLSVSEGCLRKLNRVRALMKKSGLEESLEELLDFYLEKKDPVKKAERSLARKSKASVPTKSIPAVVRHRVNLRDQGKCQIPNCLSEHYPELHHQIPRAQGGLHTQENLITLCSAHHRMEHFSERLG